MKKYQVGIEFLPSGEVANTKGLVSGKEIDQIRKYIKLNKKTNTYTHTYFDENKKITEIWKLTKKEYNELKCGFGLTDFGDFAKSIGII